MAVFEAHTGDWQSDGENHYKTCPFCRRHTRAARMRAAPWSTASTKKVCDTCQLEYGEAGPHRLTEHAAVAATWHRGWKCGVLELLGVPSQLCRRFGGNGTDERG